MTGVVIIGSLAIVAAAYGIWVATLLRVLRRARAPSDARSPVSILIGACAFPATYRPAAIQAAQTFHWSEGHTTH